MFNLQQCISLPWRSLVKPIERSTVGLLMATGLITGAVLTSQRIATAQTQPETQSSSVNQTAQPLEDGVYLYGQSEQPNQLGSEYLVFEVNQGQIVGGFYMPRSSFDCFYGNVEANQLALTVIDSYEQTPHAYAVSLKTEGTVAEVGSETAVPVGLEGYHRLETLSDVDQQILTTCKADRAL